MGTITPNSNIILLQGVPLNNDYNETVFWSTAQGVAGQAAGIMAYPHITITNKSYQRVGEGILRVNLLADSIYNYNYMMFKNIGTVTGSAASAGYVDKWFYAFITNIEYVNERACNVFYEIDEIQTWFFDAELLACYVEREHVSSDNIGEHTLSEPIDLGSIICDDTKYIGKSFDDTNDWFDSYNILVFMAGNETVGIGRMVGGIYSGSLIYKFSTSEVGALNDLIQTTVGDAGWDAILSAVMCPNGFTPVISGTGSTAIDVKSQSFSISRPSTLNGYTPKNNKLKTAPYMFFQIDVQTDSQNYKYEYFDDPTDCYFTAKCSVSPNPEIIVQPQHYNSGDANNLSESVRMDGFPQCALTVDAYRAYMAQQATDFAFKQAGNAVTILGATALGAASVATGNAMGAFMSATSGLQGMIGGAQAEYDNAVAQNKGSSQRGVQGTSTACGIHNRAIAVRKMCIKAENARVIDDFFTRFGYSCHRIKVPNRNVRTGWTYTKTIDASIHGNIPSASMEKIKSIYNNGIAFFRSLANVGNYAINNDIG